MKTLRGLLLGECRIASRVIVKGSPGPYLYRMSEDGITGVVILGVLFGREESPQMLCNRPSISIMITIKMVNMKEIRCFLVSVLIAAV